MTHWFSRVQLVDHPRDMALIHSLSQNGEAYRDHALMWRLFPGDGEQRDFLFRRETDARGKAFYYVVSARAPQEEAGLLLAQSKPYAPELDEGDWVRFDLRANPTISRSHPTDKPARGRRHDVLMDAKHMAASLPEDKRADYIHEQGAAWALRRAADWGLSVASESLMTSAYTQHRLRKDRRSIEFSSLDYRGVAQVSDARLLSKHLINGIGHAKAFGCGLLLVRRVE